VSVHTTRVPHRLSGNEGDCQNLSFGSGFNWIFGSESMKTKYPQKKIKKSNFFYIVCYSLADPDAGSVLFWPLDPGWKKSGSGIRNKLPR
jgi:hypothetical protein